MKITDKRVLKTLDHIGNTVYIGQRGKMKLKIHESSKNNTGNFDVTANGLGYRTWASAEDLIDVFGEGEFYKAYAEFLQREIEKLRVDSMRAFGKLRLMQIE